jgi:hypothetical protein
MTPTFAAESFSEQTLGSFPVRLAGARLLCRGLRRLRCAERAVNPATEQSGHMALTGRLSIRPHYCGFDAGSTNESGNLQDRPRMISCTGHEGLRFFRRTYRSKRREGVRNLSTDTR